MSIYDWPPAPGGAADDDDVTARHRFSDRRRRDDVLTDLARVRGRPVISTPAIAGSPPPPPPAPPTSRTEMWVPLGPSTVIDGQAAGDPRITGRVRALHVSADGSRIYAASGKGGVWFSNDSGATWTSLGGFAPVSSPTTTRSAHRFSCGAMLVRPNPDDVTVDQVFVGTGEPGPPGSVSPGSAFGGVGILVAIDPATGGAADPWTIEAPNLAGHGIGNIAADPAGPNVVAATSIGLFERPSGAVAGSDWVRVAAAPFDELEDAVSDVLWTPAVAGGPPSRLWVWVRRGDDAGLWVRDGNSGDFEKIDTPGYRKRRGRLAAASPPTTVYLVNDRWSKRNAKTPALYRIASTDATEPTVTEIDGVPDFLGRQGFWDLAIAVDPTDPAVVVLGGSATSATNPAGVAFPNDAAIFSARITTVAGKPTYGGASAPVMIGVGCHADVHDLRFTAGGNELWAACDGGVFSTHHVTDQVGFVAHNDGISALETNYVATHPVCEGRIVSGLQDNGIIERSSSSTWRHTGVGDGGGVIFDPTDPDRYLRQYHNALWDSSDGAQFGNLLRRDSTLGDRDKEIDKSAFYSRPAAISVSDPLRDSQVAIGTTRVWYTQDWGLTYVTLPSASDPITKTRYNLGRDDFGDPITVCRWAEPDILWVVGFNHVARMVRTPGTDNLFHPGDWTRDPLLERDAKDKKDSSTSDAPIRDTVVFTDLAPNPNDTADGTGSFRRGAKGAAYLGAVAGDGASTDTLYWFDGDETWHATGLRAVVPAPVTAVVTDPADADAVYVGTTVGAFVGSRTIADPPTWTWRPLVNGLPEAAVEDLALYDHGGVKLLRAAVASRGIWEIRLDADLADLTYVRVHDDDLRYRSTALLAGRDGVTERSWHGSPDVRPRVAPAVTAAPASLPWERLGFPPEELRRFQAALRSQHSDPRVRPTGEWDLYDEEVYRDLGAPTVPAGFVHITEPFWSTVMVDPHRIAEPWGAGPPTESDLLEFVPDLPEGDAGEVSCTMPAVPCKVDVVVHHRGLAERDGADVRVTLLRWTRTPADTIPRSNDPSTWVPGDISWHLGAAEVLNSTDASVSNPFEGPEGGWRFVGRTQAVRRTDLTGRMLDNLTSGVVTFDLDLTPFRNNTVMVLVAVIRAGADIVIPETPLRDLVLGHPGIVARSIRIER